MATCSKCGSTVGEGVKYCAACGAPVEATTGSLASPISPPPVRGEDSSISGQGGIAPNMAALLTYLPVCLIGLVCAVLFGFVLEPYRKNRFIRFHAWQSLAVHGAFVVLWIGWTVFSMLLTAVARIFGFITFPISLLLGVAGLGLMVVLMLKAYGNQTFKVPVVGDWAEKQASKGE